MPMKLEEFHYPYLNFSNVVLDRVFKFVVCELDGFGVELYIVSSRIP